MDDDQSFIDAFESGRLPNAAFHHRDHVRLSWLYLRRGGPASGSRAVLDGIRHFAVVHGAADRFHVTLTLFWVKLVQHLIDTYPGAPTFDDLVTHFPRVLDKSLVYKHYSPEHLGAGRQNWLQPDLRPMP
jgi:hypothetical protein